MKNEQKEYTITILDTLYTIVSDESQEHIAAVEKSVDTLLQKLSEGVSQSDLSRIAILAALQFASDSIKKDSEIMQYSTVVDDLNKSLDAKQL